MPPAILNDLGGNHVVGAENAVHVRVIAEDLRHRFLIIHAHKLPLGSVHSTGLVHAQAAACILKTEIALVGVHVKVRTAADVQKPAAAARNQMLGGDVAAVVVVRAGGRDAGADRAVNGDDGCVHVRKLLQVLGMAGQNDTGHLISQKHAEEFLFFLDFVIGYAKQQLIAASAGIALYAGDDAVEKEVVRRGNDEADKMAVFLGQRPGQFIGMIIQLLHGVLDTKAGFLADAGGGHRNARALGNVLERSHCHSSLVWFLCTMIPFFWEKSNRK